MRPTGIFFGYMLGCLLLAALLSIPLLDSDLLADEDPQRVLGRLAQVLMLLGLWPFLRALGLARRAALGYNSLPFQDFRRDAFRGWLFGSLMMAAIVILLVVSGARALEVWSFGWLLELLKTALRALIVGLLIAVLEETFFRGALFTAIRRRDGLVQAAGWSAALYAVVHFMKPHGLPADMAPDALGIAWMVASVFAGLLEWRNLDSLVALWLAGVLLALLRERTGSIAFGIGVHAAWVFVIQTSRRLTDGVDQAGWAWLAGDYDGIIGWLAVAVLAMTITAERLSVRMHRGSARNEQSSIGP
ncbi:CPBP family intramembrane glutamic endopeptidase [Thiorhodovibrio frisius]|uniref:CAAX amino terminal protease family n=1 Tax=Thiorhodovibrio frisius TaxID=631362 RepID=H8Z6V6_9GAMM|nr:CPBP family intramembrane glutamic endopeptidase [Thiorhodovibrio frisius]EIC19741.1 CAAX amino terminal protease family [Thiorhodovibrio frisius]WPL20291.1 CAAX amino terminal protease self- immunity [Thiorhodovibrio frisius]